MSKPTTTSKHIRCLRPSGAQKSYRFQEKDHKTGSWVTLTSEPIQALAVLVKAGKLNKGDLDARADTILKDLYAERDKGKVVPILIPGNNKILDDFLRDRYPARKLRDMADRSYDTEVRRLQSALLALGNLPVDGDPDKLQKVIDRKYQANQNLHERRTTSINRLRLFLGLTPIMHMRKTIEEIAHLRVNDVEKLIKQITDPAHKALVGVAFYTGMRRGEIYGLEARDVKGDVIHVKRQVLIDGKVTLPKHRKTRKAFIIPGGEKYVKDWLEIKDTVSRHTKISSVTQKLAGVRFHDLRHSTAIYLIAKGATLDWVARVLGHSRETCERYYAGHVIDDDSIVLMRAMFK